MLLTSLAIIITKQ